MKVNLNDKVKLVLSDKGVEIYQKHIRKLNEYFEIIGVETRAEEYPDMLEIPLWEVMQIFGSHIGIGLDVPFTENSIFICLEQ